jgi:hypothetical protein
MRILVTALAALAIGLPSALVAQDSTATPPAPPPPPPVEMQNAVRPGMSEQDVRARWGDPVAVKRINEWTYLFYRNYDEANVGFNDVVMLQNGQVVDAVVRGNDHVYLGTSSSPGNRMPEATPPTQRP